MSWFSGASTPTGPTVSLPALGAGSLHPVSKRYDASKLYGTLAAEDTSWLAQPTGFVAETQVFYATLPAGQLVMCQVVHSSIGLWYPQIQFTFRFYDPHTKEHVFKSANVTNFKTPAPATGGAKYDKRSCRSDQFSILVDPAKPDRYTVTGKYDDEVQVSFTFDRAPRAPGWKLGADARGGFTYFGLATGKPSPSPDVTAAADGYVVHRFWPRCIVGGSAIVKGAVKDLSGGRGIFIHAIQGMRANLIASRWNFCNFQSIPAPNGEGEDEGVSVTLMELTTVPGIPAYGNPSKISVASVVVGDRLVSVSCGPTTVAGAEAKATHCEPIFFDPDTEYRAPSAVKFEIQGPSLLSNPDGTAAVANALPPTKAEVTMDVAEAGCKDGNYVTRGLIEKVDFMAQIPYVVKKVIAAVAGARPYIYTWMNPVTANIEIPVQLHEDKPEAGSEVKTLSVKGHIFCEATYICDL